MNAVAWSLQILLAVGFALHGYIYVFAQDTLERRLLARGGRPSTVSPRQKRVIGVAELLAAIGLIAPGLLHLLTWLIPLASLGLVFVMASASIYHVRRGESPVATLVLLVVALSLTILRWRVVPLA